MTVCTNCLNGDLSTAHLSERCVMSFTMFQSPTLKAVATFKCACGHALHRSILPCTVDWEWLQSLPDHVYPDVAW